MHVAAEEQGVESIQLFYGGVAGTLAMPGQRRFRNKIGKLSADKPQDGGYFYRTLRQAEARLLVPTWYPLIIAYKFASPPTLPNSSTKTKTSRTEERRGDEIKLRAAITHGPCHSPCGP